MLGLRWLDLRRLGRRLLSGQRRHRKPRLPCEPQHRDFSRGTEESSHRPSRVPGDISLRHSSCRIWTREGPDCGCGAFRSPGQDSADFGRLQIPRRCTAGPVSGNSATALQQRGTRRMAPRQGVPGFSREPWEMGQRRLRAWPHTAQHQGGVRTAGVDHVRSWHSLCSIASACPTAAAPRLNALVFSVLRPVFACG